MSIPSNPIPSEEERPPEESSQLIISNDTFPEINPPEEAAASMEMTVSEESPVVEGDFTEAAEDKRPLQKATAAIQKRPAYLGILAILGLLMLCCLMAIVMVLLLRQEIFAAGML